MTREKAFTLVELLIVIAIIGILTVAFLPNVLAAPAKARDAVRMKAVRDIVSAIEVYSTENGSPPSSEAGTGKANCFTDIQSKKLSIKTPKDSKKLNSCNATNVINKDNFFYRFYPGNPGGNIFARKPFYVVATKLENDASANFFVNNLNQCGQYRHATCPTVPTSLITNYIGCLQKFPDYCSKKAGQYKFPMYVEVGPK